MNVFSGLKLHMCYCSVHNGSCIFCIYRGATEKKGKDSLGRFVVNRTKENGFKLEERVDLG